MMLLRSIFKRLIGSHSGTLEQSLRSRLPTDLQSTLKSDLNLKQLNSALKMIDRGVSPLPSYWFKSREEGESGKEAAREKAPMGQMQNGVLAPDSSSSLAGSPSASPSALPRPGALKGWSLPLRKKGGRNHHGKITVRHRGGGFKRRIRILDIHRQDLSSAKWNVLRLEHDPNRSAKIALIQRIPPDDQTESPDALRYILASENMQSGSVICNQPGLEGATLSLQDIPLGSQIHSIESKPGRGGQLVRSAGCYATLVGKDSNRGEACIRLPSGKTKKVRLSCRGVLGRVGNADWQNRVIGKAGRNRNLGRRPTVRGVAMNAVDHPHGGGKGGRSKGKPSQSPWGWICK